MMPSKSAPNLQTTAYHRQTPTGGRDDDSPPPAPPVRDSSSLKSIKYGPGHEKFPSWPVPAVEASRSNGGGSSRSKSWTDHTSYPKEKVVAYTRPYMKRQHSQYTQQKLKTVMERCEKIPPETFESRKLPDRMYLPTVDHDGKPLGDADYSVPSPPERDFSKPQLTQKDLEEYARTYHPKEANHRLTESGLEEFMEFNRSYEESLFNSNIHHQKQVSYAQSEGYHSYVSSSDSTSTPFLDRLRRDSEAVMSRPTSSATWEEDSCSRREGRDSVVTTSSGSASSSETLKWHGSLSDVSVASSSCTHLASQSNASSRQLIAHSARVQTPQRHHSESVLYMSGEEGQSWPDKETRNNKVNKLKLFPVNTYTVQEGGGSPQSPQENNSSKNRLSLSLQSALSVADRISELEKQQKYSYLDPTKKHKVPDPTLKAIQKKALLSFYERHQHSNWKSEPQLAQPKPAPKVRTSLPSRRASSASDYASNKRCSLAVVESKTTDHIGGKIIPRHQHSNSCGSISADLGPMILGPSISVDDYVPAPPERPPKNPNLRGLFPDLFQEQRLPSPDLPPPSPPNVIEHEVIDNGDPLPPPPPECDLRLKATTSSNQVPQPQVKSINQNVGIPERSVRYSLIKTRPTDHIIQQVSSKPYQAPPDVKRAEVLGFPSQRGYAARSSARYPRLVVNGNIAVSQKVNGLADQHRPEPLKPIHKEAYKKQLPNDRIETHRAQRASIAEAAPPLQPRHLRINQSMRAKMSHDRSKVSPVKEGVREGRSSSLSQSKASYLASRRDRELIVSDSETGSYKRTMSPNGHPPSPETEPPRTPTRETVWPLIRQSRDPKAIRRPSMDKKRHSFQEEKREEIVPVLPDVLPVNAKMIPRSPQSRKSPPSPPKSPFTPLRTTTLSYMPTSTPKADPPHIKASLGSPIRTSPSRSHSPKIEGLQLMQRTEVVLRVNTSTSDASSQTEPPTPLPTRKKLQEEIECEKLSQDFVNHLPTSDRLKDLLVPGPEHKKPTDYVQGLFRVDVTLKPRPANSPFSNSPPPTASKLSLPKSPPPEPSSPLSCSSIYFTTSEPKAKFLTRFSQECHAVQDTKDLSQKKEELVSRLDKKLEVLRGEALIVMEECRINDDLGVNVENHINRVASPQEVSKFRLHVEEVGKITSLLLGLSGRLARAENALMNMEEGDAERTILESKRDKLQDQLEEAKKLKECIDKRSINVSNILYKYLNSEEYADYDHFINMKAKLIMDSKEINDKIKLGEEQLGALRETTISD